MKFHTKILDCFGRNSFRKTLPPAFAAAMLLAASAAHAAPIYSITDLGVLPGGSRSVATDINDHGQVVGCSGYDCVNVQGSAFLWANGVMTDLGNLANGTGVNFALGINNNSQVVGTSPSYTDGSNINRAFLWWNGVMTDLGHLPGENSSGAVDINNNGQVVGGSGSKTFSWQNSVMTDLGLPLGSSPTSINDYGQVVGTNSLSGPHAILWQSGAMTGLGALPGGGDHSYAVDINNTGQVVGQSGGSGPAESGPARAFLWDENAGMHDLGFLPGANYSVAYGINDRGEVVGESSSLFGAGGAFLWDDGLGMLNLNDLLIDSEDWRLWTATAINNSGQIVGNGLHNGVQRAFLLTPVDAGPETETIAPGMLDPGILDAVEENKTAMQPGLFESFSESGFSDGVAGFDPTNETFVLVHGWNGVGSYFSSREKEEVPGWISTMAGDLREKKPDANILAWNWTQFADSEQSDSESDLLGCQQGSSLFKDCGIVPVSEVNLQALNLALKFGRLYSGLEGEAGDVQFLGHSLGAAIAANAVNFLPTAAPDVDRLTLFDPPENITAIKIGGKVDLDTVLPLAVQKSPDITIENYSADSNPFSFTGYGTPYADVANTNLLGYTHTEILGSNTPMDWYDPTVNPSGDGNVSRRGLSEMNASLRDRYNQIWENMDPDDDWNLSLFHKLSERITTVVLESWHDLKDWGTEVIQAGADAAQYIADVTETLIGKVGSAIASLADGVTAGVSELADWASTGVASFIEGLGLQLTSNSPSYAYTTLHVPDNADSIYFEFMPQVWALGDSYIILFDDDVLYRIDGEFFENAWMDTGFLDVSRWAGRDVQLTIGLLSDEAGHQITTGGFGFTSRVVASVNSVPEPGSLWLLGIGLLGLIRLRYSMAWQAGMRRKLAA